MVTEETAGDDLVGELADLAAELASEGARRLVAPGRWDELARATKTSGTDLVTAADRASEAYLTSALRAARPGDAVVGEEGADQPGTSGVRWIIDPIDGTTNFVYGLAGFNVSVAAEVEGRVVAAAVADPGHGDLFRAATGHGATRNGVPLAITARPAPLEQALVGTGFSYEPDRRRRQAEVLVEVLPRVRDLRRVGAAAVDLCWVAAGRLDAFYERGLAPWDRAAGGLMATEAGARVGGLDGGQASAGFTLAAHPDRFDQLADLLTAAGAADA